MKVKLLIIQCDHIDINMKKNCFDKLLSKINTVKLVNIMIWKYFYKFRNVNLFTTHKINLFFLHYIFSFYFGKHLKITNKFDLLIFFNCLFITKHLFPYFLKICFCSNLNLLYYLQITNIHNITCTMYHLTCSNY